MTSTGDLARLRLAAQRIVDPTEASAADVVAWMTALQAQDFPGALDSVALRIAGGTRAEAEAALDAGDVVRSWPMRGTLHLVPAIDLPRPANGAITSWCTWPTPVWCASGRWAAVAKPSS